MIPADLNVFPLLSSSLTLIKGVSLSVNTLWVFLSSHHFNLLISLPGMNQFGQMGMQTMGQRSTPPLPLNAPLNQVGIPVIIAMTDNFGVILTLCFKVTVTSFSKID